MGPCKCCCYQEVTVSNSQDADLGGMREKCYCCIPSFDIFEPSGEAKMQIHQPTCCGGACVNCCAQGCCNCRIPFYVYGPDGAESSALMAEKCTPVPNSSDAPN